jgi:hypothetical protein
MESVPSLPSTPSALAVFVQASVILIPAPILPFTHSCRKLTKIGNYSSSEARIHATPEYPLTAIAGITMRFGGKQGKTDLRETKGDADTGRHVP